MTDTTEEYEEIALRIGKTVLKFISPVLISVDGVIPKGKTKGQLIIGYVGTLTDFTKKLMKVMKTSQCRLKMADAERRMTDA